MRRVSGEGLLRAVASNGARPEPAMAADLTGILRQTSLLLRSVPEQDLNAVAAASRLRSFRRGQVCSPEAIRVTR